MPDASDQESLLVTEGLCVDVKVGDRWIGFIGPIDFSLPADGALALYGESGCGKTLVCMALMGLLSEGASVMVRGSVRACGQAVLTQGEGHLPRGRGLVLVPQWAAGSLNPYLSVADQFADVFGTHFPGERRKRLAEVPSMLQEMNAEDADRWLGLFPHQLSVGSRQRVLLGLALACQPRILVADEPTSALDVVTRSRVVGAVRRFLEASRRALLLTSHEPWTITALCKQVAVMYAGRIVEVGPVGEVFGAPLHPYTFLLLACLPHLRDQGSRTLPVVPGSAPVPSRLPTGCRFHPRCPYRLPLCSHEEPRLRSVVDNRRVACHLYEAADTEPPWKERTT